MIVPGREDIKIWTNLTDLLHTALGLIKYVSILDRRYGMQSGGKNNVFYRKYLILLRDYYDKLMN